MKDVAARCGVSDSTVSHMLNHTKFVALETRRRVAGTLSPSPIYETAPPSHALLRPRLGSGSLQSGLRLRFDAVVFLLMNGPNPEVSFEVLEGLFDLGKLQIHCPQFFGDGIGEVTAQEVAAFAAAGRVQAVPGRVGR